MSTQYRQFLEPVSRGVDSYVNVEARTMKRGGSDINLKIADCNRTVSLSFDVRGGETTYGLTPSAALRKLEKLERALAIIREHIEQHYG